MALPDVFVPLGATLIPLNGMAIILRFWSRILTRTLGWDDFALLVAFILFVFVVAFVIVAIHFGLAASEIKSWHDPQKAANYFTNMQIFYIFAVGMEKLSIGLVLLRLTRGVLTLRTARIIIITATVMVCAAAVAVGIVTAKQCRPQADLSEDSTNCISSRDLVTAAMVLSAVDMAVNFLFSTLPIWMLKGSGVRTSVKISLIFLLGLGFLSTAVTIVRFKYIVDVRNAARSSAVVGSSVATLATKATIFSILELGLGIPAAALVAIRPLARSIRRTAERCVGVESSQKIHKMRLSLLRVNPSTRAQNGCDAADPGQEHCEGEHHTEHLHDAPCTSSSGDRTEASHKDSAADGSAQRVENFREEAA